MKKKRKRQNSRQLIDGKLKQIARLSQKFFFFLSVFPKKHQKREKKKPEADKFHEFHAPPHKRVSKSLRAFLSLISVNSIYI